MVVIGWDYGARGIWWVLTKEEKEAPVPPGRRTGTQPPDQYDRPRPWSDRLSGGLNATGKHGLHAPVPLMPVNRQALQERGRELAIRVQDELGTDDWEVLYQMGGRMFRVHPPGGWPVRSWQQNYLATGSSAARSAAMPRAVWLFTAPQLIPIARAIWASDRSA